MDSSAKNAMFAQLVEMGFKEIEVAFPRRPSLITTSCARSSRTTSSPRTSPYKCSPNVVRTSYGARTNHCTGQRAIVHFYNSTSTLQRRVVFGMDMEGVKKIAVDAAALCKSLESTSPDTISSTSTRLRVSPVLNSNTRSRCATRSRRDRAHARAAPDPQPSRDRRDVHAQSLRRRDRMVLSSREAPRRGTRLLASS